MVHPPDDEVARLMRVAREVRDATQADGFTVGAALRQHSAFTRTRRSGSTLERDLAIASAVEGASLAGLGVEEVHGGFDIVSMSNGTVRRYRVRSVQLDPDGNYKVMCNKESSLLKSEPPGLLREEKWIFGYIMSDDHTADHLMAAEIVGSYGDRPCYLKFGTIIDLSDDQSPRGFTSTNEGLSDFDDDGEDGDIGNIDGI